MADPVQIDSAQMELITELATFRAHEKLKGDRRWWMTFAVAVAGMFAGIAVYVVGTVEGRVDTEVSDGLAEIEKSLVDPAVQPAAASTSSLPVLEVGQQESVSLGERQRKHFSLGVSQEGQYRISANAQDSDVDPTLRLLESASIGGGREVLVPVAFNDDGPFFMSLNAQLEYGLKPGASYVLEVAVVSRPGAVDVLVEIIERAGSGGGT